MITLDHAYLVTGLMFAAFATLSLGDMQNPARARNALFWGLVACSLLFGSYLGDFGNGLLVIALVGIGAGMSEPATASLLFKRTSPAVHALAMGLIVSALNAGQFLNPLLFDPLRRGLGVSGAFVALGLVFLVVAGGLVLRNRHDLTEKDKG